MKEGEAASTGKSILGESELKNGKLDSPSPLTQPPKCPECASQKVWKDGLRYTKQGDVQRYLCRSCGYRFSETVEKIDVFRKSGVETADSMNKLAETSIRTRDLALKEVFNKSSLTLGEDVGSHSKSTDIPIVGKGLYALPSNSRNCRVCETDGVSKNLVKVETRLKRAAGATKLDKATLKGKVIELGWHLKKEGYSPWTIENYIGYLMVLMKRGANLYNPESVKEVIAQQDVWSASTKNMAVAAYKAFASFNEISWKAPRYKAQRKLPFIPLESEIDSLIANSGKKMATMLLLLKETAMRIGEAIRLKWIDVDLENNTVAVNAPEKSGNPRMLKISNKLAAMLNVLPRKNDRLFATISYRNFERNFHYVRKRTAAKLQNPRLLYIHFHTLRHWKATMEYHKTKDILHVMKLLGHRNIQNTLLYTQLITFESDEYHSAVAKTVDEAKALIEEGFEYVCTHESLMLFRKRK